MLWSAKFWAELIHECDSQSQGYLGLDSYSTFGLCDGNTSTVAFCSHRLTRRTPVWWEINWDHQTHFTHGKTLNKYTVLSLVIKHCSILFIFIKMPDTFKSNTYCKNNAQEDKRSSAYLLVTVKKPNTFDCRVNQTIFPNTTVLNILVVLLPLISTDVYRYAVSYVHILFLN